jgi:hypothetical protein
MCMFSALIQATSVLRLKKCISPEQTDMLIQATLHSRVHGLLCMHEGARIPELTVVREKRSLATCTCSSS